MDGVGKSHGQFVVNDEMYFFITNYKYIVDSVQWALNGLENRRVEKKSFPASQLSSGVFYWSRFTLMKLGDLDFTASPCRFPRRTVYTAWV